MGPVHIAQDNAPVRNDLLVLDTPESPAERSLEKKRIRRHQILDVVRTWGPISRVEIARQLSYNLPTVSSLVDELVTSGLVIEEAARPTKLGRRPIPVTLNGDAASVLGIDAGARNTTALLMNLDGKVIKRVEHPSPAHDDTISQADFLANVARDLISNAKHDMPPLAGVAVALRGFIRVGGGDSPLASAPEKIRTRLSQQLGVPVLIENDARVMAMSAMWFENLAELDTFAVINVGSGLGSGIVINRRLYDGYHGHAGELGHLPLGKPGIPCYCGGNRCLENIASGAGIERMALERRMRHNGRPLRAEEIFEMAAADSTEAKEIVQEFTHSLALGISVLMGLFSLQAVVISGRVARSSEMFIHSLRAEVERLTIPTVNNETKIFVSNLKENSTPYGACAYVLHHIFSAAHVPLENII